MSLRVFSENFGEGGMEVHLVIVWYYFCLPLSFLLPFVALLFQSCYCTVFINCTVESHFDYAQNCL